MSFRIADSFTDSLAQLTGDEQKAAKTTAFDLQMNPANPGMKFHRLDKSKDKNFWSVRVSSDIRLIVHKTNDSLMLCYVDHHDAAYRWAERRKVETHPKTGAAQLVEVRERIEEIVIPRYVEEEVPAPPKPPIFESFPDDDLLGYGVPEEWLDDVRQVRNEDALFEVADHLPQEAAEALLELATGGKPEPQPVASTTSDPFEHPDAKRRFRVMSNTDELERALNYPWEKWSVFLHPNQNSTVERDFNGPARVSGSAGTGKTIVALHRAVYLAQNHPHSRVLLTTFSETLANALRVRLRCLIGNSPRLAERLEVHAIEAIGKRLYEGFFGKLNLATEEQLRQLLREAASNITNQEFSDAFLWTEWNDVIDAWQLKTWEEYRDVARLGRKKRLAEKQREVLWGIFEVVQENLDKKGLVTRSGMFCRIADHIREHGHRPFDYAVVDEAQDIGVAELKFLAAMGANEPNSLFFAGDLGQRIFQQPFSWKSLGVDIRGRSQTLRINYRTSHQIRSHADRLLPPALADVDGNEESRRNTISVFDGANPTVRTFESNDLEIKAVSEWIKTLVDQGYAAREIGVFVRSTDEIPRAHAAVEAAGMSWMDLSDDMETKTGHITVSPMHQAKGLEFRGVIVMACDDEVIPHQERIESVSDESDLEEVYQTERHLLYVACTRARDSLLVTGVEPASEFLEDLCAKGKAAPLSQ
jgi:superfamily I DNA/RNA helicase